MHLSEEEYPHQESWVSVRPVILRRDVVGEKGGSEIQKHVCLQNMSTFRNRQVL